MNVLVNKWTATISSWKSEGSDEVLIGTLAGRDLHLFHRTAMTVISDGTGSAFED